MDKIFIIGKIGSGKSYFAELLNKQFCKNGVKSQIVDLDKIGHKVRKSAQVQKALSSKFGYFVTKTDLAKLIFKNAANTQAANQIMHPFIYEELSKYLEKLENLDCQIAIVEQSVFAGSDDKFAALSDTLIYVSADRITREKRCIERGMNLQDFVARDKAQITEDIYEKSADIIIDNNNDKDSLIAQINKLVDGVL